MNDVIYLDSMTLAKKYFNQHLEICNNLNIQNLEFACNLIIKKFEENRVVYTCGNGGSAHTASHFITDWIKMARVISGKKYRGFSLCDNIGMITAYANDVNYDEIFSGQLKSVLSKEDLVIGISGSGNSKNVINAIEYAKSEGADTLAVVGFDGGKLIKKAKYNFHVPSFDMQICEDIHLTFGHIVMKEICQIDIKK